MARRQFSREFKVEAVRLVRERGVSVAQAARDLDLGLGERSGVELLKSIARAHRPIKVLIISGCADHIRESTRTFAISNGVDIAAVFAKPLDLSALRQALVKARELQLVAVHFRGCVTSKRQSGPDSRWRFRRTIEGRI